MPAPVAAFTFTPDASPYPATVTFTDTSTNAPTSWAWDFGDHYGEEAAPVTSQNPVHIFTKPGTFVVKLTSKNADGSSSAFHSIHAARTGKFHMAGAMDAIAATIEASSLSGLVRACFGYPFENPPTPCIMVGFPDALDFDWVFGGGTPGPVTFPVWFIVDKVASKESRDAISDMISSSDDLQDVMEDDPTLGGAISDNILTKSKIEAVQIAGVDYQAVVFEVKVIV
jgi:PKD repeat protein